MAEKANSVKIEEYTEAPYLLLDWFQANARKLPWRDDPTPYHVWISEIMLQQTRVEAVKPYYKRFLERLPDIEALAECPEEVYLKLWEGLGYYSRVRNLHAAAVQVMEDYDGRLPRDWKELQRLKGIGSYTAGAIASIAYGNAAPAVDGNVLRVLMRLTGSTQDIAEPATKKKVEEALLPWLNEKEIHPGNLNQALMELGAIVCLPNGAPLCDRCPWQDICTTKEKDIWEQIPVKKKAKARRIEQRTVFVLENQEGYFFHKRPAKGLLAGLYELPNVEGRLSEEEALAFLKTKGFHPLRIKTLPDAKHIFSHVEWHMAGYQVLVEQEENEDWFFVDAETAGKDYAIPSAFKAYVAYLRGYKNE